MKNPLKPNLKTESLPIILLILSVILSFYFFSHFPESVPTHWNAQGQADGYSGQAFAAFFFPLLNIGIYLLMLFIPLLDPKKENYKKFSHIYHIFKAVLVIFLTVIYLASSLNALGYDIPINVVVPTEVGILFVIIGHYLKDIKQNWFFGIRTPWTLSSDKVWEKTHKFGSKIFIAAGAMMVLGAAFSQWLWLFMVILGIMIIAIFIYSYLIYKNNYR